LPPLTILGTDSGRRRALLEADFQIGPDPIKDVVKKFGGWGRNIPNIAEQFPAIHVMAITKDRQVIALYHQRVWRGIRLEFSGGNVALGQDPEQVIRERLLKETGYVAGPVKILVFDHEYKEGDFDPASCPIGYLMVLATNCELDENYEGTMGERSEVILTPLEDWVPLLLNHRYIDGKTATITLAVLDEIGVKFDFSSVQI